MTKGGWVYIMANRYRGGMYVGVTSDLTWRVYQHREGSGSIHVTDFGKTRLVYAERHEEIAAALVEADNSDWCDLWEEWLPANAALAPSRKESQALCQARGDDGSFE